MCSSMSVFLILSLPFQKIYFHMGWQSVAAIGLIAICKMLEFQMSARVLRELSAFELKAWLGITLFLSYIMDVVYGEKMRWAKLVCISVTVAGLVLIAKSARDNKVNYRKIAIPLLLYLISKFGYGLVIKSIYALCIFHYAASAGYGYYISFAASPKSIIRKNVL